MTVLVCFTYLPTAVSNTQLAIEYCHRLRERSPEYWVFWLHASSSTRLETSVREMAEFLELPGWDDSQVNVFQLFGKWLLRSKSQWLLVIDDADSEDVPFHPMDTGKRPFDYLFVPTRGQIIRKIRPSAADLLSLMSFFDHRGIPKTLLRMDDPIGTVPPSETSGLLLSGSGLLLSGSGLLSSGSEVQRIPRDTIDDIELERDISMLHDFHLLAVKVDTNDLEMHPLVHLSALKWLESHGKRDEYMYKSMETLSSALDIPMGDRPSDHLLQWKKLYPHVQLALESEPQAKETWHLQLGILERASGLLFLQHRYPEAEILARRMWVECKHHFLDESSATLISENNLGGTLMALGRYEDAFALFEHILGVAERQFETGCSFLITCLNDIGRLECKMERFAEAEAHLRRALDHIGDSDEHEHKRVLCIEKLVGVLQTQRKHQEANEMCHQLLEFCTEKYGRDHRYVLVSSRLLAELLQNEDRLDEASEVLQQGLEAVNPGPTLNHLDIWHATMSLVSVLGRQKKMREVADLLRR
jgi:tetratricopeptide (TPR) repeat protein